MRKLKLLFLLFLGISSTANAQSDTNVTSSGLKYLVVEKGTGQKAEANKSVEVHYTGYFLDGRIFDSSIERNEPIDFVLGTGKVIKGWDEGIALMNVGDKLRLIIPSGLAYGEKGAGSTIPPNSTLIFDVELISVNEMKTPISEVMMKTISEKGIEAAINEYRDLKINSSSSYNFKESQLNNLGYQLLQTGKMNEAIEVLKLNIESYPNSANAFDSMGEACMIADKNELAIENYKKSLELNPENENARQMLEKLQK